MAAPVSLVVCGAAGRMGCRIMALADADPGVRVIGAVEARGHAAVGRDAGELAGLGHRGIAVGDDLSTLARPGTVVVDFTERSASLTHARIAAERGAAIVIGTTGLQAADREAIARRAESIPVLLAPNMSLGVNVLLTLVRDAVRRLGPGFDCEIVELHHGRKKDAPSGTALALAEVAAEAAGLDPHTSLKLAREGMVGERTAREIGVVALRGGDNPGEHTVMLLGAGERLELTHRASSRDCLAAGALAAARWLAERPAGLYSMQDVIGGGKAA